MSGALILLLVGFLSQGALCVEFNISVPQTIEVFSGYCVTIPCSFVLRQGYNQYLSQACAGIWRDSHTQEVFDSRKPQTSKINGALTGKLEQKDCTTTLYNMQLDNSDTYHFRLDCGIALKWNFLYQPVKIVVRGGAPQIRSSSGCIKHADQVSCSCEAEGVPAPSLLWLLDGFPVNHSDEFAISHESLSDAGVRSNITVNQPQERNLSTLVCRTTNSLGTASQRFYVFILESLKSESQGQVPLSVFIGTAVFLTAAFVCSLLFALRAQCGRSIKGQSAGNADPFANSCQMPNRTDEDIYLNCKELQGPNLQPAPIPEASSPQEDSSLLNSSVIWKPKPKKKKEGEEKEDCGYPSGCSYLEEERCMLGSMKRNSMINSLPLDCLYAQVKFKDKNAAQK